jgi:6-methylsalicylate decarboxylase
VKTDIHQHIWTEPLLEALSRRTELPFVREEQGLTMLFGAGERPYAIDLDSEAPARRAELVAQDGLDRALVCLSSPLGIESLERRQATPLIDAYLDGALALGAPFGVWGVLALDGLLPNDVDRALERGCVGISLPAGALGSVDMLARMAPSLERIQSLDAPLFVHPGPAARLPVLEAPLADPLWWPALTRYVAEMQAAWLVWVSAARRLFPELRAIFSMLAGLAPLQFERLRSRGGPAIREHDPLVFYDTSSYGPHAVGLLEQVVGAGQLVYGSDRPVVDPRGQDCSPGSDPDVRAGALDWELLASGAERALARSPERKIGASRRSSRHPTRVAVLGRAV